MFMRKRNIVKNMMILASIIVLVLCEGTEIFSAKKITLEGWGFPAEESGFEAAIGKWNAMHPDIQVRLLSTGTEVQNPQKLLTAIAAGTPPDFARVDRFQIASWVSRGAFLPIDEYVKGDLQNYREIFYGPTVDEATYQGHVWGIPINTDSRALYLNVALFKDAGLDPGSLDTGNWEQLKQYAIKLTRRSSAGKITQIGFVPTQDPWSLGSGGMWLWGWANGGKEISDDGKRVTLNDPKFVEALEWAVDVIDSCGGIVLISDLASGFGSGAQEGFLQGKIAIRLNGDGFLSNIARYVPNLEFTVKPIRYRNSDKLLSFSGGYALIIPKGSRHPKEAWQVIKYLSSMDGWKEYVNGWKKKVGADWIPYLSANKEANNIVINQLFEPAHPKFRDYLATFVDLLKVTRFRAQSPVAMEIHRAFLFEAQQEAQYHRKTPKQALDDATKKCQAILDEYMSHQRK